MANSGASFWYKGAAFQIVAEVAILYLLVKFFDVRESEIVTVVLLYFGVHFVIWTKKSIVRYLSFKFLGGDVSESTFHDLLSSEFPKPTKVDLAEPELYFDGIALDENYSFEQRLFASIQSIECSKLRSSGDLLGLFQSIRILKKALLKYKNYIDSKERREAYSS